MKKPADYLPKDTHVVVPEGMLDMVEEALNSAGLSIRFRGALVPRVDFIPAAILAANTTNQESK